MADTRDVMMERLLDDAGIREGMRVLDVGCAFGALTFLVARRVGGTGQVVGLDRDPQLLSMAREKAREQGLSNVTFIQADLAEVPSEQGLFDAVVGRRVLMYQPDAVAALRSVARAVKPGGLVVFQENDASIGPVSLPPLPLHIRVSEWIWHTVEREGADLHMGFHLAPAMEQAGLRVEHVRAEALLQTPKVHYPMAPILRAMLPRIVGHGVATEAEMGIDTIDQRLIEERTKENTTYLGEMVFGAWARKPSTVGE
ncbi:class I SAM-dependent methyltransferase [Corallococcus interemptor]|uniref:class I SAM-dependent methyltransferase n=1 Tax=Corallococcus interemptor TaxID=2316720 RepID=UPI003D04D22C